MIGTCGTCGRDAEATQDNEGYSYCCNDRIEYGEEAAETKARIACETKGHVMSAPMQMGAYGFNGTHTTYTAKLCVNCGHEEEC